MRIAPRRLTSPEVLHVLSSRQYLLYLPNTASGPFHALVIDQIRDYLQMTPSRWYETFRPPV